MALPDPENTAPALSDPILADESDTKSLVMPNQFEQLKEFTIVVSDTGDVDAVRRLVSDRQQS